MFQDKPFRKERFFFMPERLPLAPTAVASFYFLTKKGKDKTDGGTKPLKNSQTMVLLIIKSVILRTFLK